ncbi:MAG: IS3 family transposase, partial [Fusobacteria bacterium]|nr:IS3 family transposase [Fusobacteriota bacterium]
VKTALSNIAVFHTDRGNEFKNLLIENVLDTFEIQRSLSKKGCPYDNAVAESTYKVIKTEFVKQHHFKTLRELEIKLADYIHWYNNIRIHGSLNYLIPKLFRKSSLIKIV